MPGATAAEGHRFVVGAALDDADLVEELPDDHCLETT